MKTSDIQTLRNKVNYDLSPLALEKWNPGIQAADSDSNTTISVLDVIGEDYWTGEGVTAKRIAAALRYIGDKDVTVNINSPGGDMFEGLAIYNTLREHKGKITVKILGLAASAASIIAMAGDEVQISRAGFVMIHNCWVLAAGNRHALREIADWMEPFDRAMAGIYQERTGLDEKKLEALLDAESWIGGQDAIDQGFADVLLSRDAVHEGGSAQNLAFAARKFDRAMARSGMPRTERKKLFDEIKSSARDAAGSGTPGATGHGTRDAAVNDPSPGIAAQLANNLLGVLK
ncbi:head maturation protease, ClpP-related, partial [Advenella kashmirensis]|uniref:head maturation protease, ClpP-related n=1 Tax=Advenella kashmirensis TaxID=310575 RepID=UPI000420D17F